MNNGYRSGWSHLGEGIGVALIILSLLLGMGGCGFLISRDEKTPIVIFQQSKP